MSEPLIPGLDATSLLMEGLEAPNAPASLLTFLLMQQQSQATMLSTLESHSAALRTLTATVPEALNTFQSAVQSLDARDQARADSRPSFSGPKVKDPPTFNGSAKEVDSFLRHIEDSIKLNPSHFPNDEVKVLYLARHFNPTSSAERWYAGIRTRQPDLLGNCVAFVAAFKAHFGDPNLKANMQSRLEKLRQTGPCPHYASDFREITSYLELTEESKCDAFFRGLDDEVKKAFVYVPRPTTYDTLEKESIRIDNGLRQYRRNKPAKHPTPAFSSPPIPTPTVPTAAPSSSADPDRMEIDALRIKGPLTPEEKQRRIDKDLCLYCAAQGHRAAACPMKEFSGKAKPRA